ncbi:ScbR family autoregulator-binding transcription factor [Streptomyces xanthochromogenes]|uniref:ScbR family autoregulator-binding transcription factor n=1 Tax=Streptomyces xanthochromogenes TaxID=67384 RepID=UPI00343E2EC2
MSKQERATRTRRALIQSAAHVFDQGGYTRARIEQVSQGAGVSRGALFFHFANKEALADAVEADAARSLRSVTCAVYRRRESALQALVDSTHALARLLRHDLVVRGGFQVSCDMARGSGRELWEQWQAHVDRLLREAVDAGDLLAGASRRDAVRTVVAATAGFRTLGHDDEDWLSPLALTCFWRLLLPRLATPAALAALRPEGSPVPPAPGATPTN